MVSMKNYETQVKIKNSEASKNEEESEGYFYGQDLMVLAKRQFST